MRALECALAAVAALLAADAVRAMLAPFREMSASASLNYALARRKAVVASDLPPNRELDCVCLFPAGDAAALAEAVREVAESPERRRALADAAGRYAARHSYAALAEECIEIYRRLREERAGS